MPRPMKDSPAAVRMALATPRVGLDDEGGQALGLMCFRMILVSDDHPPPSPPRRLLPSQGKDGTRMIRAYWGVLEMPTATILLQARPWDAAMALARRIEGWRARMSRPHMIRLFVLPP